ncbi:MAG: hypothetical protein C4540_06980 [Candidatus Omnitrophota bacterium]|nr:MAG: hypothetical protein C4540_06980 [Candidatus Omnitrophota bacterium]
MCGYQPIAHTPKFETTKNTKDPSKENPNTFTGLLSFLSAIPVNVTNRKPPQVKKTTLCIPIIRSLATISSNGTMNACLFLRYAPPNNAIAATGVKFGTCGITRTTIPTISKLIANILTSCIF